MLTDQTLKYRKSPVEKLNDREKVGTMLMDEIWAAKLSEFSRSYGRIYGMEEVQPIKTLLTLMFKSVAAAYEDVIVMVPLTKIDSQKIFDLFTKYLQG